MNLTISLPSAAWQVVLQLVARGPYGEVKEIIEAMLGQLQSKPEPKVEDIPKE